MTVKNIILDLGGVLLDVDYEKTARAFKALGLSDIDAIYSQKRQERLFDDMDKGLVSNDRFRAELKKHLPATVSDEQVDRAWNAMLGRIPPERMRLIRSLNDTYRLFLLSNTNRIHVESFQAILEEDYGPGALRDTFEKIYLSCFIHMRKPDREIFELVVGENDLRKEETIFIDDSIQHIHGGQAAGIPSHFLDLKNDTLENLLTGVLDSPHAQP